MNPVDLDTTDTLQPFVFEHFPVRGELAQLDSAWQAVLARCEYPLPVRELLGQAMVAAALLTATLKFRGSLTLQLQGDGGIRLMVVQCNNDGELRGLAHWSEGLDSDTGFPGLVGDGTLVVTIDPEDQGERYQSVVPLEGDSLEEAFEAYFRQSEQLETRLWLAAGAERSAGFMLQKLPRDWSEVDDPDGWERVVQIADTLTDDEILGLSSTDILRRLYHAEDVRIFDPYMLAFRCRCSRERIEHVLRSLGREEIEAARENDGAVVVDCEFCNQRYRFDRVDVERLFTPESLLPNPSTRH